jgi:hypothetical protein
VGQGLGDKAAAVFPEVAGRVRLLVVVHFFNRFLGGMRVVRGPARSRGGLIRCAHGGNELENFLGILDAL